MIKTKARSNKRLTTHELLAHEHEFGLVEAQACSICGVSMADLAGLDNKHAYLTLLDKRYAELRARRASKGATDAKHDRGEREIEL